MSFFKSKNLGRHSYDGGDDIRDLIKTKHKPTHQRSGSTPPFLPNLPPLSPGKTPGRFKPQPKPIRSRSKEREGSRSNASDGSSSLDEDDEVLSQTNSTTDSDENAKGQRVTMVGSIAVTGLGNINKHLKDEDTDIYRHSNGTRRGGIREPSTNSLSTSKRRSLSLRRSKHRSRSRSKSREPEKKSLFVKTEGKGLFGNRQLRSKSKVRAAQNESDSDDQRKKGNEKEKDKIRRSRARSQSRTRGTSKTPGASRTRGKSKAPEESDKEAIKPRSRARSKSRATSRSRGKSKAPEESDKEAIKPRTRATSRSRGKSKVPEEEGIKPRSRARSKKPKSRDRSKSRVRSKSVKSTKSSKSSKTTKSNDSAQRRNSTNNDEGQRRDSSRRKSMGFSDWKKDVKDSATDIPKNSVSSGTRHSLPTSIHTAPNGVIISLASMSQDSAIDSMPSQRIETGIESKPGAALPLKKIKPKLVESIEDSPVSAKSSGRPPPYFKRTASMESVDSKGNSLSIGKSFTKSLGMSLSHNNLRSPVPKPPKKDWRASIKSMLTPAQNENPFQKKDEKPDTKAAKSTISKEWQADLKGEEEQDEDEEPNPIATFEKMWEKSSVRSMSKDSGIEDGSVASLFTSATEIPIAIPAPSPKPTQISIRATSLPAIPRPPPEPIKTNDIEKKMLFGKDVQNSSFVKGLENSLHDKFARYDKRLLESGNKMKSLTNEVATLKDQLEAKDAGMLEVQQQLDSSILDSERQRSEAQKALEELKEQITYLQEALDDRETQIETVQRQLEVAYSENNQEMYNSEVQIKTFRKQIESIEESSEQKDAEIEKLMGKLEMADREHQSKVYEDRGEAGLEIEELLEQVATLQEMLDLKEKLVFEMQVQLDEADCENKIMMEELDEILKEKNAAEARVSSVGSNEDGNAKCRIKDLEQELIDATNVANLQLTELDEQVDGLQEKLKAERLDSADKVKSRDTTIDELTTKLRKYEAVPSQSVHSFGFQPSTKSLAVQVSSSDSVGSDKSGKSFAAASGVALSELRPPEASAISTDDVTNIENAKQKVYEARADATSVRESLEISTKKCAELIVANETLVQKNSELKDTKWERDDLKDKVRDWTAQTYEWKRRAEESESKLAKLTKTDTAADDESDHQGNMIMAAMEKNAGGKENETNQQTIWSIFGRGNNSNHNASSVIRSDSKLSDGDALAEEKDAQIEVLNDVIAKLRSELVQMSTAHKEEAYLTMKRIIQLEGENEALTLQNGTLEQLSRFHSDH